MGREKRVGDLHLRFRVEWRITAEGWGGLEECAA